MRFQKECFVLNSIDIYCTLNLFELSSIFVNRQKARFNL